MNRQETAEFLDKCRWWFEPYTGDPEKWYEAIDMAIKALKPERPRGEWHLVDHLWECDRCHYRQNKSKPTNFCPNCGADMRGDKE